MRDGKVGEREREREREKSSMRTSNEGNRGQIGVEGK